MRDTMETKVRGHFMTTRSGRRAYVKAHPMKVNKRVHRGHLKRLEKEIEALEMQRMAA